LCMEIKENSKWFLEANPELLVKGDMKVVAVNRTHHIQHKFTSKDMEEFPRPTVKADEGWKVLNRVTFQIDKETKNLDSLMHVLTKKSVSSDFDLVAIRPSTLEQLEAFLNCNNVIFDILCLDHIDFNFIQGLRPNVFSRAKQQKVFFEIRYTPILSDNATARCNSLMASNALLRFSKRFCKNFILSSGAEADKAVNNFAKIQVIGEMCGFNSKLFDIAVGVNIERCIEEAALKRATCPAISVVPLNEKLKQSWTYNHESMRRIDAFLSAGGSNTSTKELKNSEREDDALSEIPAAKKSKTESLITSPTKKKKKRQKLADTVQKPVSAPNKEICCDDDVNRNIDEDFEVQL